MPGHGRLSLPRAATVERLVAKDARAPRALEAKGDTSSFWDVGCPQAIAGKIRPGPAGTLAVHAGGGGFVARLCGCRAGRLPIAHRAGQGIGSRGFRDLSHRCWLFRPIFETFASGEGSDRRHQGSGAERQRHRSRNRPAEFLGMTLVPIQPIGRDAHASLVSGPGTGRRDSDQLDAGPAASA